MADLGDALKIVLIGKAVQTTGLDDAMSEYVKEIVEEVSKDEALKEIANEALKREAGITLDALDAALKKKEFGKLLTKTLVKKELQKIAKEEKEKLRRKQMAQRKAEEAAEYERRLKRYLQTKPETRPGARPTTTPTGKTLAELRREREETAPGRWRPPYEKETNIEALLKNPLVIGGILLFFMMFMVLMLKK